MNPRSRPSVELLYWEGCPSWPQAVELVLTEMEAAGLDPADLVVREVGTAADAARERFHGSPTVLVDGTDVQDPGDDPVGLSCRVYRRPDGTISPLPDRAQIRAALVAE